MNAVRNLLLLEEDIIVESVDKYFARNVVVNRYQGKYLDVQVRMNLYASIIV